MAETKQQQSGLAALSTNVQALIGCLVASPLAVYFYRRGDIGRVSLSLVAGACLVFIVAVRWTFRKMPWFWLTILIAAATNIGLIVLIPFPVVHGPVLAPVGAVGGGLDYLMVLIAMKIVGAKDPDPSTATGSDQR